MKADALRSTLGTQFLWQDAIFFDVMSVFKAVAGVWMRERRVEEEGRRVYQRKWRSLCAEGAHCT